MHSPRPTSPKTLRRRATGRWRSTWRAAVCAAVCTALVAACGPGEGTPDEGGLDAPFDTVSSALSAEARAARYAQIRDAAAARGIDHTAYLLGGIAHAETGLAHCWSEAQWACQGPDSADCGGGPVIAGAGDGPCADRQGGLGMFQFDAGTFDDTLGRYGPDVLTVAGNVSHALDYVIHMVMISQYTTNAENEEKALQWIARFDVNDAGLRDQWISTVTRYYNGCRPEWNCWGQRYGSYDESLQTVLDETGLDFWSVVVVPPDQPPHGALDAAACDGVRGWAQDADAPGDPLDVHLYFGGPAGSGAPAIVAHANENREDLCGPLGSCEHGFAVSAPLSLFDGQPHAVHAYGISLGGDQNAQLDGSPGTLNCPPALPAGVRRHVIDPDSYGAWRLDAFMDRVPAPADAIGSLESGDDLPALPVLVQRDDGAPEVWVVDGTRRRHVPSRAVMAAWRFDFAAIQRWPVAQVQALEEGPPWRARPVQVLTDDQAVWLLDDTPAPEPMPDAGPGGSGGEGGEGGRDGRGGGAGGQVAGGGSTLPDPVVGGGFGFGGEVPPGGGGGGVAVPGDDAGAYTGLRQANLKGTGACSVAGSPAGGGTAFGALSGVLLALAGGTRLRSRIRRRTTGT